MNGEISKRSDGSILTFLSECKKRTISSGENLLTFLHTIPIRTYSFSGSCSLALICLSSSTFMSKLTKFLGVNAKCLALWSLNKAVALV
jgi:hypothetical protein